MPSLTHARTLRKIPLSPQQELLLRIEVKSEDDELVPLGPGAAARACPWMPLVPHLYLSSSTEHVWKVYDRAGDVRDRGALWCCCFYRHYQILLQREP